MATAHIVTDLLYGDSGKGATVDWLCRTNDVGLVVKHSGGAQCAHNVVTPDGRHHTFSQLGAGTFAGVPTFLSRFFLLNPLNLLVEAARFETLPGVHDDPLLNVFIDPAAPVITVYQREMGRIRELARGENRHGSCGQGIGETAADALREPDAVLRAGDLADRDMVLSKLDYWRATKTELARFLGVTVDPEMFDGGLHDEWVDAYREVAERATVVDPGWWERWPAGSAGRDVVFEGGQGVLLDEWFGWHPHTTWSTTTHENALTLLSEAGWSGDTVRMGVVRAYATRHGAGPFPTEDPELSGLLPEPHNGTGRFQGAFRVGWFDAPAVTYAIEACGGIDALMVTHLDSVARLPYYKFGNGYLSREVFPDRFGKLRDVGWGWRAVRVAPGGKCDLVGQERVGQALAASTPDYHAPHGGVGEGVRVAVKAAVERAMGFHWDRVELYGSWGPSAETTGLLSEALNAVSPTHAR